MPRTKRKAAKVVKLGLDDESSSILVDDEDKEADLSSKFLPSMSEEDESEDVDQNWEPSEDDLRGDDSHESITPSEDVLKFECLGCDESFKSVDQLLNHVKKVKALTIIHVAYRSFKMRCSHCPKTFELWKELKTHVSKDHKPVKKKNEFPCEECGKVFVTKPRLAYHKKTHVPKQTKWPCPHCPKVYNWKNNLEAHMLSHTGELPHRCPICNRGFRVVSSLHNHVRGHYSTKSYQCTKCDKSFRTRSSLTKHSRVHAGLDYECSQCGKKFKHQRNKARHEREVHDGSHRCKVCGHKVIVDARSGKRRVHYCDKVLKRKELRDWKNKNAQAPAEEAEKRTTRQCGLNEVKSELS